MSFAADDFWEFKMVKADIVQVPLPAPTAETGTELTGELFWSPDFLAEIEEICKCDDLDQLVEGFIDSKKKLAFLLRDSMERIIASGAFLERARTLIKQRGAKWSELLITIGVSEVTDRRHRRIFREFENASSEERKSIAAGGVRGFLKQFSTGNGQKNGNEGSSGESNANGRRQPKSEVEGSNPEEEEQPETKSEDSDPDDDDWSDTTLDDPQETADTAVEAEAASPNTAASSSTEEPGSMTPVEEFFAITRRLRELEEPVKRQISDDRSSIPERPELVFRADAPVVRKLLGTIQDLL